jgi:hypothetical protein
MGTCHTFYEELRFDVRDPHVTHVYCFVRGEGDCPVQALRWHHKVFPANISTLEIHGSLWNNGDDPVLWERADPPLVV